MVATSDCQTSDVCSVLISEFEKIAANKKGARLPSSQQLYRIGQILYLLVDPKAGAVTSTSSTSSSIEVSSLIDAYRGLMESLPNSYLQQTIHTYQLALEQLSKAKQGKVGPASDPNDILLSALESLYGLLSLSSHTCYVVANDKNLFIRLASLYDHLMMTQHSNPTPGEASSNDSFSKEQHAILGALSHLYLDGILGGGTIKKEQQQRQEQQEQESMALIERVMDLIQGIEEQSTDCLGDLQAWQNQWDSKNRNLESSLKQCYFANDHTKSNNQISTSEMDNPQLFYLLDMLETGRQRHATKQKDVSVATQPSSLSSSSAVGTKKSISSAKKATADELERRIQQIQQILPDLGSGFIEAALSMHQGDVERTISLLLSSDMTNYPAALRAIDRKLPRQKQTQQITQAEEEDEAQRARQLVKERMALEDKLEQERYEALVYASNQNDTVNRHATKNDDSKSRKRNKKKSIRDEYEDDYDDQYDEFDGVGGPQDNGWYDFEMIRKSNQVVREEQAEQIFWEDNRNRNHEQKQRKQQQQKSDESAKDNGGADGDNSGDGKKYRGPDKIKGGRVIGPDGKIVKNARGRKQQTDNNSNRNGNNTKTNNNRNKKNNNNDNNRNNKNQQQQQSQNQNAGGEPTNNKPRTKPKANNRVNQKRDRKQKAQGAFGVES